MGFVEEIVGPDGIGRVEIKKVENNGFYEEAREHEAIEVEMAIVQSYLSRAAAAGFSTARIHVSGQKRSLFLAVPPSPVPSSTANLAACMELLREARGARIVYGFQDERGECGETVVRAQLMPPGAAPRAVTRERDADIACPVAQTAQDWVSVQKQHGYKFEDLQFAKFSSMMLVYHLIKGWRKEFTAPPRQASSADYDSDDASDDTPPPSHGRRGAEAKHCESGDDSAASSPFFGAQTNLPRMPPMAADAPQAAAAYAMPAYGDARREAVEQQASFSSVDNLPYDVRCMLEAPVEPLGARGAYASSSVPPPPPASPPQVPQELSQQTSHRSLLDAASGDSFWTDSLFTEQPVQEEESPFWDCFFNTL